MDTQTLAVGQEVYMFSEVYTCKGKVIKVTPEGVEVRATVQSNLTRVGDLLHFDNSGKGRYDEGTHECGAWQLVNPFEQRVKEQHSMANSYRPIKGSAVAASVPPEYLKKFHGLVVGQKVRMTSGCYGCEGRVVDISPSGIVEVQTGVMQNDGTWNADERLHLLHFDNNGKGRDAEGTIECGPWYIDRMPFADCTKNIAGA
jgi:hypothetical protein